jgi:hypothetical protein
MITGNRSRLRKVWLTVLFAGAAALSYANPPSLWLAALGAVLLVSALAANTMRTGQNWSWQNEGSLSRVESSLAGTGIVLALAPVLCMLVRAWVG